MASKVLRADSGGKKSSGRLVPKSEAEENAINREIATLLLNLHATGHTKAEDLSLKQAADKAMDLSSKSAAIMDLSKSNGQHIPKVPVFNSSVVNSGNSNGGNSGSDATAAIAAAAAAAAVNYPFYPSSLAMTNPALALNSNYLLQNLLLGKMQQMQQNLPFPITSSNSKEAKSSSKNSFSSSTAAVSFPTQPIPAQSLANSNKTPTPSVPASVLKAVSTTKPSSSSPSSLLSSSPLTTTTTSTDSSASTTTIPLLCGQIVAQLNALLFLVHNLSGDAQLELSLQAQLSAIYMKLQEIVSAVEVAKSHEKSVDGSKNVVDEEKIAKQLQEYQRALMQQVEVKSDLGKTPNLGLETPLPATLKTNSGQEMSVSKANNSALINVSNACKKRRSSHVNNEQTNSSDEMFVHINDNGCKKRRGRPPKNADPDTNVAGDANGNNSGRVEDNDNGNNKGNKEGSKGIRNRVFCGECSGCLKNDDCGICRYCKDKTKFGGQNRLRQKCLHRRCHMDTHRRRPTNTAARKAAAAAANSLSSQSNFNKNNEDGDDSTSPRASPSPNAIYSGVDLARLAAAANNNNNNNAVHDADVDMDEEEEDDHRQSKDAASTSKSVKESAHSSDDIPSPLRAACSDSIGQTTEKSRARSTESSTEEEMEESGVTGGPTASVSSGKNRSRIDRWKAKHEAMLKMASTEEGEEAKEEHEDEAQLEERKESSSTALTIDEGVAEEEKENKVKSEERESDNSNNNETRSLKSVSTSSDVVLTA